MAGGFSRAHACIDRGCLPDHARGFLQLVITNICHSATGFFPAIHDFIVSILVPRSCKPTL